MVIDSDKIIPIEHSTVFGIDNVPPEVCWARVDGGDPISPYAMHRIVNRIDVDVVHRETTDDRRPRRWVIVRNGVLEAWARVGDADEYGYPIRPDERPSDAELEAIHLKHAAMNDGESVDVADARAMMSEGDRNQIGHALIALFYAARADPDVPTADVDTLRDLMHEHTGHVDTSHVPTVRRILGSALDGGETEDA